MNIEVAGVVQDITLTYGKRSLSYGPMGYSYWYGEKEVSNELYKDETKWKKLLNKYNKGYFCIIEKYTTFLKKR